MLIYHHLPENWKAVKRSLRGIHMQSHHLGSCKRRMECLKLPLARLGYVRPFSNKLQQQQQNEVVFGEIKNCVELRLWSRVKQTSSKQWTGAEFASPLCRNSVVHETSNPFWVYRVQDHTTFVLWALSWHVFFLISGASEQVRSQQILEQSLLQGH